MVSPNKCVFYGCQAEALGNDLQGLCQQHRERNWYSVVEAAGIWNASERTVRDWIHPKRVIVAERQGRRPWRIPAAEFLKPHPSQRAAAEEPLCPAEPAPEISPQQTPETKRRWSSPAVLGAGLFLLLVVVVGFIGVAVTQAPPIHLGRDGTEADAVPFAGLTPHGLEFERWSPAEPALVRVGHDVAPEVEVANTGGTPRSFYTAASLKSPDGEWVDLRPLRRLELRPGERGDASWTYAPNRKGAWDLVYGKWGNWAEGEEPQLPLGNTGIIRGSIVAFQECQADSASVSGATILAFAPFLPVEVKVGDIVPLSVSFTNVSDRARAFAAGATVWDSEGNIVANGDYETALDEPVLPGESATVGWEHAVVAAGSYQVQFAVWDRAGDRILVRAPCPREKLMVGRASTLPTVTGIDPDQPRSAPNRQWLSIRGENFNEESVVILSILGNVYNISRDRTEFASVEELRVLVGLTQPGTWSVQVVNPEDMKSNIFEFTVLP